MSSTFLQEQVALRIELDIRMLLDVTLDDDFAGQPADHAAAPEQCIARGKIKHIHNDYVSLPDCVFQIVAARGTRGNNGRAFFMGTVPDAGSVGVVQE